MRSRRAQFPAGCRAVEPGSLPLDAGWRPHHRNAASPFSLPCRRATTRAARSCAPSTAAARSSQRAMLSRTRPAAFQTARRTQRPARSPRARRPLPPAEQRHESSRPQPLPQGAGARSIDFASHAGVECDATRASRAGAPPRPTVLRLRTAALPDPLARPPRSRVALPSPASPCPSWPTPRRRLHPRPLQPPYIPAHPLSLPPSPPTPLPPPQHPSLCVDADEFRLPFRSLVAACSRPGLPTFTDGRYNPIGLSVSASAFGRRPAAGETGLRTAKGPVVGMSFAGCPLAPPFRTAGRTLAVFHEKRLWSGVSSQT